MLLKVSGVLLGDVTSSGPIRLGYIPLGRGNILPGGVGLECDLDELSPSIKHEIGIELCDDLLRSDCRAGVCTSELRILAVFNGFNDRLAMKGLLDCVEDNAESSASYIAVLDVPGHTDKLPAIGESSDNSTARRSASSVPLTVEPGRCASDEIAP